MHEAQLMLLNPPEMGCIMSLNKTLQDFTTAHISVIWLQDVINYNCYALVSVKPRVPPVGIPRDSDTAKF